MKIVEIAFTGYPVTDIQRAPAFYEDVLKLESTRTFESGDRHWTEYDLGPSTFAISNMSSEDWNTVCTKVLGPVSLSSIMSEAEKYALVTTKRNTYD
jgi:hypothetical protein